MYLVKFLFFGAIVSVALGELGQFPFGASTSVGLTDILLALSVITFVVWKLSTKEKIALPTGSYWLITFYLVAVLSWSWSLTNLSAIEILPGGLYLIRFILYSQVLMIGFNLLTGGILSPQSLVRLMIGVAVVLSVLGLVQLGLYPNFEEPPFYLTEFGFDPHRGRLAATFLDPNFLGAFLVLSLGMVITNYLNVGKGLRIGIAMLLLLTIFLTLSRSAYLMMAVSVVVLSLVGHADLPRFKTVILVATVIILMVFLFPQVRGRIGGILLVDASAVERFISWEKGITIFSHSPVLGVGFNNLRVVATQLNLINTYTTEGGHSGSGVDSSLLMVLATTGIVGFITYLAFWIENLRRLALTSSLTAKLILSLIIGLFLNSQFINSLFFPPLMLWYFLILAVCDFSVQDSGVPG